MSWFSMDTPPHRSDEEILTRSISRPWEFAELVTRYETAFLRKAMSIIHNERDAQEIVQDTFTKIYLNANRFVPTPGATFSSWSYRILCNTAFTYYQKRRREGERVTAVLPEYEAWLTDDINHTNNREMSDAVERVLAILPEHFAVVLRLHYLERWPHKDIATELGETPGTIKVRIYRAKSAFRRLVEKQTPKM